MTRCQWLDGASKGSSSFAFVAFEATAVLRLEVFYVKSQNSSLTWRWAVLGPDTRVPVILDGGGAQTPLLAQKAAEERAREILLTLALAL